MQRYTYELSSQLIAEFLASFVLLISCDLLSVDLYTTLRMKLAIVSRLHPLIVPRVQLVTKMHTENVEKINALTDDD